MLAIVCSGGKHPRRRRLGRWYLFDALLQERLSGVMVWKRTLLIMAMTSTALALMVLPVAAQQVPRAKGIERLVLVGWRENGSVLYTAVGGTLRTYTVVVAVDGTSAAQDYDIAIGRYQLLTQLSANANNEPLKKAAVTLSRTDLISFQ